MLSIEIINVNSNNTAIKDQVIGTININFLKTLRVDTTVPVQSYSSTGCGKATIDLTYRITSNCPENMYGFKCGSICIPIPGQYYCNYLGQRVCLGNYTGSLCVECLPYHYPMNNCTQLCTSRNDATGHYDCHTDGSHTCLRNFDGPDCLACKKNFYGNDCMKNCTPSSDMYTCSGDGEIICSGNFQLPDCVKCQEHYYGPNCSINCSPRIGQYKCISEYPYYVRLENYTDPECNYEMNECNYEMLHSGCIHYCKDDKTSYCNNDGVKGIIQS